VKLSRVNTLLLISIILVNGLTIVMPFVPSLLFTVEARGGEKQKSLEQRVAQPVTHTSQSNRLIMPDALFDQPVFDGPDARTLNKGVWHRPHSSTPDKKGNTVFAAHRFTYRNPQGAFYNLDKLKPGARIGLLWNNTMYRYTVWEVKVVGPDATYIEAPTKEPQLTLYTCTPLTLPKDRLVVIAKPAGEDQP
jgi:sortase A